MEDQDTDQILAQRLIKQTMDLWVEPEIKRRHEADGIPLPLPLSAAQVIFDPDAEVVEIRLNEEVKAVGEIEAEGPVEKGQLLRIEPSKITNLVLTDSDPNAGHITLYAFGPRWVVSFDFRRNASRIKQHLGAAREFLDVASHAREGGKTRAFAENLFAAVELLAKSILLTLPGREILESKRHPTIARRFNRWAGKLGNADPRFAQLLNHLDKIRGSARYLRAEYELSPQEAKEMEETAEEMYSFAEKNCPTVVLVNDQDEEEK